MGEGCTIFGAPVGLKEDTFGGENPRGSSKVLTRQESYSGILAQSIVGRLKHREGGIRQYLGWGENGAKYWASRAMV